MASGGERRMLFDTSSPKRRRVIKVVYAILALLMGASLFLVIGPVNIGELIGNSSSSSNASQVFDEQAERIERRLVQNPDDPQQLLALTRARINAGNAQIEVVSETETPTISASAQEDFEAASQAWNRYLKQAGSEPNANAAQLVAGTFFRVAEGATTYSDATTNIARAATAQEIAAEQRPSIGSLTTLAIYKYYNGDFAVGDKAFLQARAKASTKAERKAIEEQLAGYRKTAAEFQTRKKKVAKAQKKLTREQLQNPLDLGGTPGGAVGE